MRDYAGLEWLTFAHWGFWRSGLSSDTFPASPQIIFQTKIKQYFREVEGIGEARKALEILAKKMVGGPKIPSPEVVNLRI